MNEALNRLRITHALINQLLGLTPIRFSESMKIDWLNELPDTFVEHFHMQLPI
jgi:hypothetical protein